MRDPEHGPFVLINDNISHVSIVVPCNVDDMEADGDGVMIDKYEIETENEGMAKRNADADTDDDFTMHCSDGEDGVMISRYEEHKEKGIDEK